MVISRRDFAACLALTACGPRHGSGFAGFALIANETSRTLAAVDLSSFSVKRTLHLEGMPGAVIGRPRASTAWILLPQSGTVCEVTDLEVRRRRSIGGPAVSMQLASNALWVLQSHALVELALDSFMPRRRIRLPAPALAFDMNLAGRPMAAVCGPDALMLIDLTTLNVRRVDAPAWLVRFQSDGRQVLLGGDRRITIIDTTSARIVTHLPLPFQPEHFCFNGDGGQLFATGTGMDAVAIVYPYNTEVDQTVLAGRTPGAMAVVNSGRDESLVIANRESAEVTVMSLAMRKVTATIPVGAEPGPIAITPDNQYILVVNRQSGDLAVIRVAALAQSRGKRYPAPLFTMIPVGVRPVSAAVVRA